MDKKREHPKVKVKLHPRNKHRERYNFRLLCRACPELIPFVKLNDYHDESIDFFNPEAVKMLNTALLSHFYGITFWNIPDNYLCPPIPGRADYIHYVADLIGEGNTGKIQGESQIKCLDIGVGANCVYPIIGNTEYGWSFVGTDIDLVAIESANKIVELNPQLKGNIELRLQQNPKNIFIGIIQPNERFDVTICNPPFHASAAEAQSLTMRKLKNLKQKEVTHPKLNFGGQNNELWCDGGEEKFVTDMLVQSKQFAASCLWFTCLISKQSNLNSVYKALKIVGAADIKTISMGQGNKMSRIVAWTFLNAAVRKKWLPR
ncbi:MAG: 23S rRNA (adenine(1618)-N(6))-methyltransferase RlmF [Draconibacterium sp.]|nr:23S rRNA (adenine(1618)-N(6))-methyltransferase RlmF [Draconibacterium sp.]